MNNSVLLTVVEHVNKNKNLIKENTMDIYTKCQKCGSTYNSSLGGCPKCASGHSNVGVTISLGAPGSNPGTAPVGFGKTEALHENIPTYGRNADVIPPTVTPDMVGNGNVGVTVCLDKDKNCDLMPVRGWLVVVKGKQIGKDFRIHNGSNSIGRDKSNDIVIDFDKAITGDKHCEILYDDRNNEFIVLRGNAKNNVYLNNHALREATTIHDNDIIEVGETALVFRALCNDEFNYPTVVE